MARRVQTGLSDRMGVKTAANKLGKYVKANPDGFTLDDITDVLDTRLEGVKFNQSMIDPTFLRLYHPKEEVEMMFVSTTIPVTRNTLVKLNREKFRAYPINFRYLAS